MDENKQVSALFFDPHLTMPPTYYWHKAASQACVTFFGENDIYKRKMMRFWQVYS